MFREIFKLLFRSHPGRNVLTKSSLPCRYKDKKLNYFRQNILLQKIYRLFTVTINQQRKTEEKTTGSTVLANRAQNYFFKKNVSYLDTKMTAIAHIRNRSWLRLLAPVEVSPSNLRFYRIMILYGCTTPGSLWKIPDSNPGPLPQKSGVLPN